MVVIINILKKIFLYKIYRSFIMDKITSIFILIVFFPIIFPIKKNPIHQIIAIIKLTNENNPIEILVVPKAMGVIILRTGKNLDKANKSNPFL